MDIVEFVEKACNLHLLDYQREFIRKVYDAAKNEKRLYFVPPRGNSRVDFELLQALTLVKVAQERGLVNLTIDRNTAKSMYDSCMHNYGIEKTFQEPFPYTVEKNDKERKYDPYKYAREFAERDD